jgi:hypothetical protein
LDISSPRYFYVVCIIIFQIDQFATYDHRILRARLPVRSALFKQDTGGLVVRWVTTSESPLLYVFAVAYLAFCSCPEDCKDARPQGLSSM